MKDKPKSLDFDFGFSFVSDNEEELTNTKEELKKIAATSYDAEQRIRELYEAIEPFLDNLCRDPEKSTIHWPNRVKVIASYKAKLKQIVEGDQ